jgi:thermostable 8-oxoguanine DNA glycosylase
VDKEEILKWSKKYDSEHPWWVQKEQELGTRFRSNRRITREDLEQVVNWKFKEMPGRRKRVMSLLAENTDEKIRNVSNQFFRITSNNDSSKVHTLNKVYGVGPALASTILTFINPKEYGVFDIHVLRELFGIEPKGLFRTANYLKVLVELRKIAKKHQLDVRTVEKALFKKNYSELK